MKIFSPFLIAFLNLAVAQAQITYQKIFSDTANYGMSVFSTLDSGLVLLSNQDLGRPTRIIRLNSNGDTLWSKLYDLELALIRPTLDSGFILSGSRATCVWNCDSAMIKTDKNGNTVWAKNIDGLSTPTSDSGYVVLDYSTSSLYKTNKNGDTLWTKQYLLSPNYPELLTAEETADKGFLIAGHFAITGNRKLLLVKTNSLGIVQWSKDYDDGSVSGAASYGAFPALDGSGYIIYGALLSNFGEGAFLIKTNSSGSVIWAKKYKPNGSYNLDLTSAKPTLDGGYIISGVNFSTVSSTINDRKIHLIKTNSSGDTLWTRKYALPSTSSEAFFLGVQQALDGGFIITGTSEDTITGTHKTYLIKTDSLGSSGGCYEFTGIDVSSFSVTEASATITTQQPALIYSSISVNTFSAPITVTTLCSTPTFQQTIENRKHSLFIYPNPFSTQTTLQPAKPLKNASLTVYNSVGQTVKRIDNLSGQTVVLHRDNLPSGLYFIHVTQEGNILASDKLVVADR